MKMRKIMYMACGFAASVLMTGCEGAKDQLGLTRTAPDEFAVISRAPLEMPPDYSLRPPQPGTPRPQELRTTGAGEAAVFGDEAKKKKNAESGEKALLDEAGVEMSDPAIRVIVDAESAAVVKQEETLTEKYLGFKVGGNDKKPKEDVLDPVKEKERLENAE